MGQDSLGFLPLLFELMKRCYRGASSAADALEKDRGKKKIGGKENIGGKNCVKFFGKVLLPLPLCRGCSSGEQQLQRHCWPSQGLLLNF